jgi:hypothetical protein
MSLALPAATSFASDGAQLRAGDNRLDRRTLMLYTIAVILIILWALGFLAFHVGGGLIHLLLVIAIIVNLLRNIQGRRPV